MGVKSLWSLLTPVGRPVLLETVEGKSMAVDSSIWLYQFQATMRDKDGRGLVNAHILGFLRRILKLLFYGIKPVFVFDGGAPVLKRMTITSRKQKKSGVAASHAKIAEKLLAAQMRREALNHTVQSSTSKSKARAIPEGDIMIDENTIYLDNIDGSVPQTPAKVNNNNNTKTGGESSTSAKKHRFHDHDPYRLPDIDLEKAVAQANSRTSVPDPRLATEEELQAFIDDMRPEDFDVTSDAFRDLPTQVQYEIVGDLRLKSRQTSYKRLQQMLTKASTPIDFSRQQIINLKQRNAFTQRLLTTTDSIGKVSLAMPVRVASERNREYVLSKNEGPTGGWVLGIRDDGTAAKPIVIDHEETAEEEDEDSDIDMEEVAIPENSEAPAPPAHMDPDLREYQRSVALSAIADRCSPKKLEPLSTHAKKPHKAPLFDLADDDEMRLELPVDIEEDLAHAIQASLDQQQATTGPRYPSTNAVAGPSGINRRPSGDYDEPSRIDNYFTFANTRTTSRRASGSSPRKMAMPSTPSVPKTSASFAGGDIFGTPTLLVEPKPSSTPARAVTVPSSFTALGTGSVRQTVVSFEEVVVVPNRDPPLPHEEEIASAVTTWSPIAKEPPRPSPPKSKDIPVEMLDDVMEVVVPAPPAVNERLVVDSEEEDMDEVLPSFAQGMPDPPALPKPPPPPAQTLSEDEDALSGWSRSPSPIAGGSSSNQQQPRPEKEDEVWDAANEMDPHAEEGEFARFVSQIKGKNIEDARREIDEEIKTLHQQKKVAMRDSDDITQQMISQIMLLLRLFGIPYITAPMEAEAQCAELVSLGLVDGIITDDSDVFLFGGLRVFKNMFNQSKTVECFLSTDLSRELGLDRDTLVRLAYLLGSDYVDGLPGVGPVVAMELLKEFPGEAGLHKFKDWWLKVQTGKDKAEESSSAFKKRFKKKFKDLYLGDEWPNTAVRDAYYHPKVDHSDEPFKWGIPDLDALRAFLREELGWPQPKVDELLVPIIQKMGKRTQADKTNKQSTLNTFFDISAGMGTYAPRKRQAYASKRLQQVVSDFRKLNGAASPTDRDDDGEGEEGDDVAAPPRKKPRKASPKKAAASKRKHTTTAAKKRKPVVARGKGGKKKDEDQDSEDGGEIEDDYREEGGESVPMDVPEPRPRPRPKPRPLRKRPAADPAVE